MVHDTCKDMFLDALEKICKHYIEVEKIAFDKFACGFMIILDQSIKIKSARLRSYNFDITNGNWIPWKDIKLMDYPNITPEFSKENFTKDELARFNSKSNVLKQPVAFTDKKISQMTDIEEPTIVINPHVKRALYLLDYFIAYNKQIMLCSDYQSGKTMIINHKLRKLQETQKHQLINFTLNLNIDLHLISKLIELSLIKQGGNEFGPPIEKRALVIIEDLNFGPIKNPPASIVRNYMVQKGWFSSNRKKFIKIRDTNFLLSLSYRSDDIISAQSNF